MKLFYYFLAENLITGIYLPGIAWDNPTWGVSSQLGILSKISWDGLSFSGPSFFNPESFNIDTSYSEAMAKMELQAPSKDHINGIEVSENITPPWCQTRGRRSTTCMPPCSRYCSPTEYRSMDTNNGTGDHEEF